MLPFPRSHSELAASDEESALVFYSVGISSLRFSAAVFSNPDIVERSEPMEGFEPPTS